MALLNAQTKKPDLFTLNDCHQIPLLYLHVVAIMLQMLLILFYNCQGRAVEWEPRHLMIWAFLKFLLPNSYIHLALSSHFFCEWP